MIVTNEGSMLVTGSFGLLNDLSRCYHVTKTDKNKYKYKYKYRRWGHVVLHIFINISEESAVFIFKVNV
jgi:hypothetical protein